METKKEKNSLLSGLTVLIIYISGLIFVGCFHEPWFDESQAWLIARCVSFKELFTYVPHYEGHPPLWHLILSVFAKNGAPFDLTIKAINITFSAGNGSSHIPFAVPESGKIYTAFYLLLFLSLRSILPTIFDDDACVHACCDNL